MASLSRKVRQTFVGLLIVFCLLPFQLHWAEVKSSISRVSTSSNGKRITAAVSSVSRDTDGRHYNTDVQAVLNDETQET